MVKRLTFESVNRPPVALLHLQTREPRVSSIERLFDNVALAVCPANDADEQSRRTTHSKVTTI